MGMRTAESKATNTAGVFVEVRIADTAGNRQSVYQGGNAGAQMHAEQAVPLNTSTQRGYARRTTQ